MKPTLPIACFVWLLVAAAADAASGRRGTNYYVGNWTSGVNFTEWSQGRVLRPGDSLTFTVSPSDTIIGVMRSTYENCDLNFEIPKFVPFRNRTWNETLVPWPGNNYYVSSVQDNCRAGKKFMVTVETPRAYTPREYTVGDDAGWAPGVNYSQWTAGKNFYFGDSFRFVFNASEHSVVQVWEEGYQFCNSSYFLPVVGVPLLQNDSRTVLKVVPPLGDNYYTSAESNDCQSGLKVELEIEPQEDAFAPAPSPDGSAGGNGRGTAGQDSSGAGSTSFVSAAALLVLSLVAIA